MLRIIDNFLNKTTMYKTVLYYLVALWVVGFFLSLFNLLPFTPVAMIVSLVILLLTAWATNYIFSYVFEVPANVESIYITVFILALIIIPATTPTEYIFLGWAGILSMASKYIFAVKHKHIFNPAAFAVAITGIFIGGYASWWIGSLFMTPFVLVGGLALIRKLKRTDLALSLFVVALLSIFAFSFFKGFDMPSVLWKTITLSPLLFFTFVMITEPLTTPSSRLLRILYGTFVGLLFFPQIHIGSINFAPEIALLFGNIFSYLVGSKARLTLKLKKIVTLAPDTSEFVFEPDRPLAFRAGQYLEWTIESKKSDNRGNRRYFTIASSPTEKEIMLGVKFYEKPSTFKTALGQMKEGDKIIGSQLSGDFVLPRNKNKKLVFIAGGIGVTPFRSMIKYLIDTSEKRDITLIYANRTEEDIAYKNILDMATKVFGLKVVYVISSQKDKTKKWEGRVGFVNDKLIQEEIADFKDRTFYISGPPSMVAGVEKTIKSLGVGSSRIKTDFFPGFA